MRKYRNNKNIILVLIYNSDAVDDKYISKSRKNEFHLPVKLEI